ncbi:MAG: PAS domain S-box protein, partial [Desulfomonilaceae bacterium]
MDFLQSKAQERFNFRGAQITQQIIQRLKDYETLLRGAAGLFVATGAVTRREWRDYVNTLDIEKHYPGVQGVGFVKVLAPSEIEKHIQEIRAEGFSNYAIRPMGDREVYTSIIYIEPFDHRNQRAFGYDMFTEPTRRTAMEKARDTGKPQITGKVKLVQEIDKDVQTGFVMYMPLYKNGDVISTSRDNKAKLFGYIGCPFRMRNFVDGVFGDKLQDVELKIFDRDNTAENSLMYESVSDEQRLSSENERLFTDRKVVDLYGHQWTLVVSKLSSFEPSYQAYQPLSILVLGFTIAFLAFLFVRSLERTKTKALKMANDMTVALRENEITLRRTNRALKMISLCNENLLRATDELEFMKDLCRITVTEGGYALAWVGIAEKNEEKTVRVIAQYGFNEGYLDQVDISYGDDQPAKGPMGKAIRTGEPIVFKDINEPDFLVWKSEAEKRGYRAAMALPLFVDGEIFGALGLYSSIPNNFDEDEVKLLTELASDLGFGITTLRTRAATERSIEAVQRSETFLQQIVENIPDMIFIKDAENLNYVSFNKAGEDLTGYSLEDLRGKNDYDFFPLDQAEFFIAKDKEVLAAGRLVEILEEEIDTRLKGRRILHTKKIPILDANGRPRFLLGVSEDITERKKAEESLRKIEERFRKSFKNNPAFLSIVRMKNKEILEVNDAWKEMLGYSRGEAIGRTTMDVGIYDDETWTSIIEEAKLNGSVRNVEATIRNRKGEGRVVLVSREVIEITDEPCLLSMGLDITERKRMEAELRKFKTILDRANYGNAISDLEGNIIYVNATFARMHGYEISDCVNRHLSMFHSEEQMPKIMRSMEALMQDGEFESWELWHKRKDGTTFPTLMNGMVIPDENGKPVALSVTTVDISALKKIENELRQSEERFRTAFRTTPDSISISRFSDGRLVEINDGFMKLSGFTRDEVIGKTSIEIDIWVNAVDRKRLTDAVARHGQLNNMEAQFRMKDGSVRTGLVSGRALTLNESPHLLLVVRDISDIKRSQAERMKLATTVDQAAESVIVTDTDGNIEYVNPAFERISGYSKEEVIGQNPRILKSGEHPDSFYKDLWTTITNGNIWTGKFINKVKDGAFIHEQSTISPVRDLAGNIVNFVGVARDVTREELLQQQLLQAQKMEAIGTLAGGIAHDFNNILFAIIGNTELAMDEIPADNPAHRDLQNVLNASTRAAEMVKQILTFSRQGQVERKPLDIIPIVKEVLKFLGATIPATIEIKGTIEPDQGKILGDPTQIHQILMNLCVNAVHAMKDKGGVLTVDLCSVCVDQESSGDHHNVTPGNYLRLTVSDTGQGIRPEILDRIFEPYFTTKNLGEGTGFGLSVVHGIVRSHNGEITVDSQVGAGSSFYVYLPTIEQELGPQNEFKPESLPTGSERILLVDDDSMLVQMVKSKLEKLGYEIVATTNPVEALSLFHEKPERFDLVFTDL